MELRVSRKYTCIAVCHSSLLIWIYQYMEFGIVKIILVSVLCLLCVALWDIGLRLKPASSHTVKSLASQYVFFQMMKLIGIYVERRFDRKCTYTRDTQDNILRRILSVNGQTAYGRDHGFSTIRHRGQFSRSIPLTSYSQVKSYVDRAEAGETNVLTSKEVTYFSMTSGTTGSCKYLPVTSYIKNYLRRLVLGMHYGIWKKLGTVRSFGMGRIAFLTHMTEPSTSLCGILKGPITNYLTKMLPYCLAHDNLYKLTEHQLALRAHAVVYLADDQLTMIKAPMAPLVLSFWIYVCDNWMAICKDIDNGRISLAAKSEANQKKIDSINRNLKPNKKRADFLKTLFDSHEWNSGTNITKRIWPDFEYITMITTGAMEHSANVLSRTFMKGIPQLSMFHTSSEGVIGINRESEVNSQLYTLAIDYGFFEFIKLSNIEDELAETVYAEQLIIGQSYEVVITSEMGMCRYRLGDIIEIVKKKGNCPIYKFKYRNGQILNLYWEKLPQSILYGAVVSSLKDMGQELKEYTSCEDCLLSEFIEYKSEFRRYILFVELMDSSYELLEEEKLMIDERLAEDYDIYKLFIENKIVAPIKVVQVKENSFKNLIEYTDINKNCQYKPRTRLNNKEHLKFLLKNEIKHNYL